MRNGFKLFATSHGHQFNHIATPEMLGMFKGYEKKVENLSLNDFRNAMHYYTLTGWMGDSYDEEWRLENLFMETQGNWNAFRQQYFKALRAYY
jgi:hypothetical protein